MEKTQWYLGAPNSVVLCVDRIGAGQPEGRFYHAYAREGTSFSNMEEAIFQLERFYDSLNFPHPTTDSRTFINRGGHTESRKERTRIMRDDELLSRHGDLGTFIIRVQHRQNSSWQGRITWMDRNRTLYLGDDQAGGQRPGYSQRAGGCGSGAVVAGRIEAVCR